MHDALSVRGIQGIGNLDSHVDDLMDGEGTTRQAIAQSPTLHELHDDEGTALVFPEFVNRADVGVVQRRRGTGLDAESFDGLAVGGRVGSNELERHLAAQERVFRGVNDTHPPSTKLVHDSVVGDDLSNHGGCLRGYYLPALHHTTARLIMIKLVGSRVPGAWCLVLCRVRGAGCCRTEEVILFSCNDAF